MAEFPSLLLVVGLLVLALLSVVVLASAKLFINMLIMSRWANNSRRRLYPHTDTPHTCWSTSVFLHTWPRTELLNMVGHATRVAALNRADTVRTTLPHTSHFGRKTGWRWSMWPSWYPTSGTFRPHSRLAYSKRQWLLSKITVHGRLPVSGLC